MWKEAEGFLQSLCSFLPFPTMLVTGLFCLILYVQAKWRVTHAKLTWLDRTAMTLTIVGVSRSAFYELLEGRGWERPSAEVLSLVLAVAASLLLAVLTYCVEKSVRGAAVLFAMFVAWAFVYAQSPWPVWATVAFILIIIICAILQNRAAELISIVLLSLWYSAVIVYTIAVVQSSDRSAYHDLFGDLSLGFDCFGKSSCAARSGSVVGATALRVLLCLYYRMRREDIARETELQNFEANAIEVAARKLERERTALSLSDDDERTSPKTTRS
jgi:hypothetical protein